MRSRVCASARRQHLNWIRARYEHARGRWVRKHTTGATGSLSQTQSEIQSPAPRIVATEISGMRCRVEPHALVRMHIHTRMYVTSKNTYYNIYSIYTLHYGMRYLRARFHARADRSI